jgi:hypothetical protein
MHPGSLVAAFLGFLAAQFPDFIDMLRDRFTHQRELESKQQELDAAAQGYQYTIHEQGEQLESQASQINVLQRQAEDSDADNDIKGHVWLQFLRSSVRPVITYGFFAVFAIVALFSLHHGLVVDHIPVKDIFPVIWDEDTEDLFAAVIAFWFGSRASSNRPINSEVNARNTANADRDKCGQPLNTILSGTSRIVGE